MTVMRITERFILNAVIPPLTQSYVRREFTLLSQLMTYCNGSLLDTDAYHSTEKCASCL